MKILSLILKDGQRFEGYLVRLLVTADMVEAEVEELITHDHDSVTTRLDEVGALLVVEPHQ